MPRNSALLTFALITACFISANAQNFRIQLAAYTDSVPPSYFKDRGVNGVIPSMDGNGVYRYFFGSYPTRFDAEKAQSQLIAKGFRYASIVDLEEQRVLGNLDACAYFPGGPEYEASSDSVRLLLFDLGKSLLTADAKKTLDWAYQQLQKNPSLEIRILGYTDAVGAGKANIELATERARAARNYLADKGVKAERMLLRVFGESAAVPAEGDTEYESELAYLRKYFRSVLIALVQP
ncbi:MAG: OmpA family protein [Thermoanaerobaculia bacterium]|nr:OmpA family protein [Thermoanaerobaculia bacterium]